jgi:hypothetical protein
VKQGQRDGWLAGNVPEGGVGGEAVAEGEGVERVGPVHTRDPAYRDGPLRKCRGEQDVVGDRGADNLARDLLKPGERSPISEGVKSTPLLEERPGQGLHVLRRGRPPQNALSCRHPLRREHRPYVVERLPFLLR